MGTQSKQRDIDSDDLISFLQSELEVFDTMKAISMVDAAFEPVLRPSPNITNINEIYQDKDSSLSLTSRSFIDSDISNQTINEEPEEEEADAEANLSDGTSYVTPDSQNSIQQTISIHVNSDHRSIHSDTNLDPLMKTNSIATLITNSTATNSNSPIHGLRHYASSLSTDDSIYDPNVRSISKNIFHQTYNLIPVEKYCAYLGTNDPLNISVCKELMKFFYPWPKSLIEALRKLCSKLYLIAESVQIDQVLEIFAQSWCRSNPGNPLGDYKSIHVICFAILILNSDLHNEQNLESKFTKEQFVENTWAALQEDTSAISGNRESVETNLKSFYDSIHLRKLELLKINTSPAQHSEHLSLAARLKKKNSIRKFNSINSNKSLPEVPTYDSLSNISIKSHRNSRRLSSIGSSMSLTLSRESTNLTDPMDMHLYDVDYKKDQYDDRLEVLGAPWMIEGLLKSELNSTTTDRKQKKNNWFSKLTHTNMIASELDIYNLKDWKQCIVIIQKGLLKQYSFGSVADRQKFVKTRSDKFVSTVLTYNLYSASASLVDDQIISNTQNKNKGVAWVLTIPNLLSNDYNEDKKIVYYAPNLDVANSFIDTCNFWAARITSIPSTEDKIVTSAEFGWSPEVIDNYTKIKLESLPLTKWECLLSIESSFIPSAFKLEDQFQQLNSYVHYLERAIDDHNELNSQLRNVWGSKDSLKESYDTVMTSWSEKYVHLYRQQQKYKIYLDSLALAISFRASKI